MKCPYCNKEIADTSVFCHKCGQSVNNTHESLATEKYWSSVAAGDKQRNQEYIKITTKKRSESSTRRAKWLVGIIAIIALITVTTFAIANIIKANEAELKAVKENLPGKELKCSYSRTETGFWIHYYYYTLKFNADDTLDYYYLTTIGPAENDEFPTLQGTYKYTITRNILGDYTITFGSESFTMTISDDNIPRSLSYNK